MTNFRSLCAELVDALDQCQRPCGEQPESSLVWKARAALAEAYEAEANNPPEGHPDPEPFQAILRERAAALAQPEPEGHQAIAKRAIESCLAQREEVLAAFIAKHGFQPEDAIQVEQRQPDGTSTWRIERRSGLGLEVATDEKLILAAIDAGFVYLGDGGLFNSYIEGCDIKSYVLSFAYAVLARWGCPAKPEVQGPTEAQLKTFACEWWHSFGFAKDKATCTWVIDHVAPEHFADFSRDVLARWSRPTTEPVPVAERLPGPKDCDAEGRCWLLYRSASVNRTPTWSLVHRRSILDADYTHWLPHWALPVPQQEAQP